MLTTLSLIPQSQLVIPMACRCLLLKRRLALFTKTHICGLESLDVLALAGLGLNSFDRFFGIGVGVPWGVRKGIRRHDDSALPSRYIPSMETVRMPKYSNSDIIKIREHGVRCALPCEKIVGCGYRVRLLLPQ